MNWRRTTIETRDGLQPAIAPEIISASRETDIPALYSEWLMNRLRAGYAKWVNPYNPQQTQCVSFENARTIVFWSKNPRPLMRYLPEIEERGLKYYFTFTLNDYEAEQLEPGIPSIDERMETFISLSRLLGKERVIWRFDPLILTQRLGVEGLLGKIRRVGDKIAPYAGKLVFAYIVVAYRKVQSNSRLAGIEYSEFDADTKVQMAAGIADLCRGWGIPAASCAEALDLSSLGIEHNKCIDGDLILKITDDNPTIRALLAKVPEDPGQRTGCRCVPSKEIGAYDTCIHGCVYCYAVRAREKAVRRFEEHDPTSEYLFTPARPTC
jgi:hypothetical protein